MCTMQLSRTTGQAETASQRHAVPRRQRQTHQELHPRPELHAHHEQPPLARGPVLHAVSQAQATTPRGPVSTAMDNLTKAWAGVTPNVGPVVGPVVGPAMGPAVGPAGRGAVTVGRLAAPALRHKLHKRHLPDRNDWPGDDSSFFPPSFRTASRLRFADPGQSDKTTRFAEPSAPPHLSTAAACPATAPGLMSSPYVLDGSPAVASPSDFQPGAYPSPAAVPPSGPGHSRARDPGIASAPAPAPGLAQRRACSASSSTSSCSATGLSAPGIALPPTMQGGHQCVQAPAAAQTARPGVSVSKPTPSPRPPTGKAPITSTSIADIFGHMRNTRGEE